MSKTVRILGIAGSLRRQSYNRAALRAATQLAPEGATIDIFELDGIPPFNEDDEQGPPARVLELKRCIREADAVLFVTPEYNYSIPGVLKNAIGWASRPYGDSAWSGKPAAVMGASTGAFGTARAQYHLRQFMVFLHMFPVNQPEVMIRAAHERFDAEGNLTDEATREYVRRLLHSLVVWTRRIGDREKADGDERGVAPRLRRDEQGNEGIPRAIQSLQEELVALDSKLIIQTGGSP